MHFSVKRSRMVDMLAPQLVNIPDDLKMEFADVGTTTWLKNRLGTHDFESLHVTFANSNPQHFVLSQTWGAWVIYECAIEIATRDQYNSLSVFRAAARYDGESLEDYYGIIGRETFEGFFQSYRRHRSIFYQEHCCNVRHTMEERNTEDQRCEEESRNDNQHDEGQCSKWDERIDEMSCASNGNRKSMFVGVSRVDSEEWCDLPGCIADVEKLVPLIEKLGFPKEQQQVLLGSGKTCVPTKNNILSGIENMVRNAKPGDALFFHFSGHCLHAIDGTHKLIAHDGEIDAEELLLALVYPLPAESRLTCVLDCCHSAGLLKLPYVFTGKGAELKETLTRTYAKTLLPLEVFERLVGQRDQVLLDQIKGKMKQVMNSTLDWYRDNQLENDVANECEGLCHDHARPEDSTGYNHAALSGFLPANTSVTLLGSKAFSMRDMPDVLSFASCELDETSVEDACIGGGLISALISSLSEGECAMTFIELLERVRQHMRRNSLSQVPQLCSSSEFDLSQKFSLSATLVPLATEVTQSHSENSDIDSFAELLVRLPQLLRYVGGCFEVGLPSYDVDKIALRIRGKESDVRQLASNLKISLPADAFPGSTSCGWVVLEVAKLLNPRNNETVISLLRSRFPQSSMNLQACDRDRSFACVRVPIDQENLLRECIKAISKERGRRASVKEIDRYYETPRD